MEKQVLVGVFLIFLVLAIFPLLQAQTTDAEELEKVNNAYSCLEDRVDGNCDNLSPEEKIFALLSIDECQASLTDDSFNSGECWPDGDCQLKTTSQAVLALENTGVNTDDAEAWLTAQSQNPTELFWYLQIESSEATTCTIEYAGFSYSRNIGEDKKISSNAGSCLVLAQDDYWFRISPASTCFDEEFQISCDEDFLTTLLFRKSSSSTVHVSQETSSAATGGLTTEKIESLCFAENSECDYEGSLWASLVLNSLGEDVSAHLPYLITFAEDNPRLLPDAFLYFITKETRYRTSLLLKQKVSKWWMESVNKFYDTALALYPFQEQTLPEKTNTKEWLFEIQDSDGCWENNVRDTGFILASIWPKQFTGGGGGGPPGCADSGYYCVSFGTCDRGILTGYDCPALYDCCNSPSSQETCAEADGIICLSSQTCVGNDLSTDDLDSGEVCCVDGYCSTTSSSECTSNQGVCKSYSCENDEEEASYSCDVSGDKCCVSKSSPGKGGFWIWFFLILIVLVVVGIIFRDRLRDFWFRISSGRRRPGPKPEPGPSHHPRPASRPIPERRILLPAEPVRRARPRKSRAQKELDDVLKKLKGMNK